MRRAFFYAVRPIQNCLSGMLTMISLACLVGGVGLATLSLRRPDHAASLERWSGICLLAGLGLLGFALQGGR